MATDLTTQWKPAQDVGDQAGVDATPFFSGHSQGTEGYNQWNATGQLGPVNQLLSQSETGQMILDPMDLFGGRAKKRAQEIENILTQSAQAGITQLEEQERALRERYAPYYQAATGPGGALSQLGAMSFGGEIDYTPSKLYEYQKKAGLAGISASQAKRGLLHSSATERRTGDFMGDLAAEEAQRAYGGALSTVQLGAGAANAVGAAGSAVSGQAGSLYQGLGTGLSTNIQAQGQQRQASWDTLGNTMFNVSQYMGQNR